MVASGELIFVLSDNGTLALVHADAEQYREGRARQGSPRVGSWTTPSLAEGRLYVRDFDELVSVDLRTLGTPNGLGGRQPKPTRREPCSRSPSDRTDSPSSR